MSSLGGKVLASSGLILLTRIIHRSIGLISTLVLARLLTPEDFGVVAAVAVIIQLFDTISNPGGEKYIIQKRDADERDLNTAWSIDLIMKTVLWLVLMVSAPLVANFYNDQALRLAIGIASLSLIIGALVNPGIILLKRNLDYAAITRLSIIQKIFAFTVMMIWAWLAPSYWVLIAGTITSNIVWVVGSYVIHPHRPKPDLSRFSAQFSFSQWIVYQNIFGYFRSQVDTLLIGRYFSLSDLGQFHVVKSLTWMPVQDVIGPAVEPLLSAFSAIKHDPANLALKFRTSLGFVIALILPICVYIAVFPDYLVDVFLGSQWSETANLFARMTPLLFVLAVGRVYESMCLALGLVKQLFYYNVVSTIFLTTALLLIIEGSSLEEFVLIRTMLGLLISAVFPYYLSTILNIRFARLLLLCIPIVLAISCSMIVTYLCANTLPAVPLIQLAVTIGLFFGLYSILLTLQHMFFTKDVPEYASIAVLITSIVLSALVRWKKFRAQADQDTTHSP